MTAVMSAPIGGHFALPQSAPRSGILLNGSPASSAPNSPRRSSNPLSACSAKPSTGGLSHPSSQSNNSSASSATSSTDDLYSSTSATSAGDVMSPSTSSSRETSKGPHSSSRKIRFAPLPEPDRDNDYDDLMSPGFFTDIDSAQSSPRASVNALLPPPLTQITPSTPTGNSFGAAQAQSHELGSTLGLSFDGNAEAFDGPSTETSTIAGSECGTDDTHTATSKKRPKWARLLRLSKPPPLLSGLRSPYDGNNLSRCSSRESNVSLGSMRNSIFGWGSLSDLNGSSQSLGNPLGRRGSRGQSESLPNSPAVRGLPLKPVTSEHGTISTPAVRAKPQTGSGSQPPAARRGIRLLNGRVYGSRRNAAFQQKNPFANVHDEPEFVMWGYGGTGSNKSEGGKYAALQNGQKVAVGHVADGKDAPADDDVTGMAWLRRRREQREREKSEKEEKEKAEKAKDGVDETIVEAAAVEKDAEASEVSSPTTTTTEESKEQLPASEAKPEIPTSPKATSTSPTRFSSELPSTPQRGRSFDEKKERGEHVTTVNVPAPRPHHHHHSHSQANSLQSSPHHSALQIPTHEHPAGPSTVGPSPLGVDIDGQGETASPAEESSPPESSASSSFGDDEDADSNEKEDEQNEEEVDVCSVLLIIGIQR